VVLASKQGKQHHSWGSRVSIGAGGSCGRETDLHSTFLFLFFCGSSGIYFDFFNMDCLSIATSKLTGGQFLFRWLFAQIAKTHH
jgi:hypothetical protein